jgi:hypothetical protein
MVSTLNFQQITGVHPAKRNTFAIMFSLLEKVIFDTLPIFVG